MHCHCDCPGRRPLQPKRTAQMTSSYLGKAIKDKRKKLSSDQKGKSENVIMCHFFTCKMWSKQQHDNSATDAVRCWLIKGRHLLRGFGSHGRQQMPETSKTDRKTIGFIFQVLNHIDSRSSPIKRETLFLNRRKGFGKHQRIDRLSIQHWELGVQIRPHKRNQRSKTNEVDTPAAPAPFQQHGKHMHKRNWRTTS